MASMYSLVGLLLILNFVGLQCTLASQTPAPVAFTFKEYQYKDSPKNEMTFREFETACEQSGGCSHMSGLSKMRCVRECVSPSCYRELYQNDPLLKSTIDDEVTFLNNGPNHV